MRARAIIDLVHADLDARRELSLRRYGQPLMPGNDGDALLDAYEDALDLVCYLRQALEERGAVTIPGGHPTSDHPDYPTIPLFDTETAR